MPFNFQIRSTRGDEVARPRKHEKKEGISLEEVAIALEEVGRTGRDIAVITARTEMMEKYNFASVDDFLEAIDNSLRLDREYQELFAKLR